VRPRVEPGYRSELDQHSTTIEISNRWSRRAACARWPLPGDPSISRTIPTRPAWHRSPWEAPIAKPDVYLAGDLVHNCSYVPAAPAPYQAR